jgi:uncharacterized cupredoxin-like copper-binding protein
MKADVRRFVEDCEHCENEKAKRRLAHGMFSGHHTDKPRSRYTMDFQGQGQATSGETVRIQLVNAGKVRHEFIIGTEAELQAHAEEMKKPNTSHNHQGSNAVSVAAGATGELVRTFTDAGVLHIACFEPGHYEAGMRGTISVLP